MSAVSATDSVANTAATATAAPNAFSSLSSEQFVKIIFSELSNQDPLQPSDSNALLQQLANLRSIQSGMDLSDKLSSLVTQNQLASASGVLVVVDAGGGLLVEGLVLPRPLDALADHVDGPDLATGGLRHRRKGRSWPLEDLRKRGRIPRVNTSI